MDYSPLLSPSDIGSSISRRRGSLLRSPMSAYDPYNPYPSYGYGSYPRRYGMYGGVPLTGSYYPYSPSYASSYAPSYASSYAPSYAPSYVPSYASSYAPSYASTAYTPYTDGRYSTRSHHMGKGHEKMYFNYDGKLIRSAKIWDYKKAQKQVLDLYPDLVSGIAASRIQFYVMRPGYSSRGHYTPLKSYISEDAWPLEMDTLAEHETVGIEIRDSTSLTESVASFFNRF